MRETREKGEKRRITQEEWGSKTQQQYFQFAIKKTPNLNKLESSELSPTYAYLRGQGGGEESEAGNLMDLIKVKNNNKGIDYPDIL